MMAGITGGFTMTNVVMTQYVAPHAYWRIFQKTATPAGVSVRVGELEFRTTAGVSVTPSGGSAIGGDFYQGLVGYAKAFDGTTNTWWQSNNNTFGTTAWVGYQFASPIVCVQVAISSANNAGDYAPCDFNIDYSDNGSSWTTAQSYTSTGWTNSGSETRLFTV